MRTPVGATGRVIRIQVDRAYEGGVYDDLYIAEVAVDFTQGAVSPKMQTWLASSAAKSGHDAYVAQIEKAYAAHKGAEFGDKESFAFIADAASEGAPYVRKAAQANAPLGYRMQAIPSDDTAREALRKLKDSNAIPALGLAGPGRDLPEDPRGAVGAVRPRLRLRQRPPRRQVPAAEGAGAPRGPACPAP